MSASKTKGRRLVRVLKCTTAGGFSDAQALLNGQLAAYRYGEHVTTWASRAQTNSDRRDYTARVWAINPANS